MYVSPVLFGPTDSSGWLFVAPDTSHPIRGSSVHLNHPPNFRKEGEKGALPAQTHFPLGSFIRSELQSKTRYSRTLRLPSAQERNSNRRSGQENSKHRATQHRLVRVQLIAKIHSISERYLHSFRTSIWLFAALPLWPHLDVGDQLSFLLGLTSTVAGTHCLTSPFVPIVKCEYHATVSGVNWWPFVRSALRGDPQLDF
jgi:hypothetical protein